MLPRIPRSWEHAKAQISAVLVRDIKSPKPAQPSSQRQHTSCSYFTPTPINCQLVTDAPSDSHSHSNAACKPAETYRLDPITGPSSPACRTPTNPAENQPASAAILIACSPLHHSNPSTLFFSPPIQSQIPFRPQLLSQPKTQNVAPPIPQARASPGGLYRPPRHVS